MVYVAKDLLRVNLREIPSSLVNHPEAKKLKMLEEKLKMLDEKLDDFLERSDFEKVGNINTLFKL
jgi:hypothetical protein